MLPKFFHKYKKRQISDELKELKTLKTLLKKITHLHIFKAIIILIIILITVPFIIFYFYKPKIQKDINYGITFSRKYCNELGLDWKVVYLDILDNLKIKNLRLVAYWDDVEATKDTYNFDDVVWQLTEAQKRGVNVIMTIGRKVPRYPECFEPDWWENLKNEEAQNMELLEYIKTATTALRDFEAIKKWQVENEPFFKFGECYPPINKGLVQKEIDIVKSIDPTRPVLVQDSGEGGFWFPAYQKGDYLGISMYRKVWYDFWHVFFGNFIYFKYPLAHWTYKIKAGLTFVPHSKIIVTELQAEPWGPTINSKLTENEKNKTMSRHDFLDTIIYAQKAGFKDIYFWGAEWWYWEKNVNSNSFFWDTAKALFN